VLDSLKVDVTEVLGVGFSGQMHGLVCLDAAGEVIRPAILWNDQRSAPQCAALESGGGRDRLVRLTGNRALPGFTAPKLLWMREMEPAAYTRIRQISLPKDYVRDRLTGGHRSDVADASGTLLLDVSARRWSEELLAELGIPLSWLPDLAESGDAVARSRVFRWPPGQATRRPRRWAAVSPAPALCPSSSEPPAWCSPPRIVSWRMEKAGSTPSATQHRTAGW